MEVASVVYTTKTSPLTTMQSFSGGKNMAAMSWSCQIFWQDRYNPWHDHGFSTTSSLIHTMIIVWSSCFPCTLDNWIILSIFSQINAAMYHHVAHLTRFRGYYASKQPSLQNWTKSSLRVFFCDSQTASLYLTIFLMKQMSHGFSWFLII